MESWPFAPWISALIARSPSAHAKKHLEYLISKTNVNKMISNYGNKVENDNGPTKVTGNRMTNYKQGCQRASAIPQFYTSTNP